MAKVLSAVIVEDEVLARQRLKKLLEPYSNQLEIVGEASDGSQGITLVESLKPELIFLDVQMPVMNGFDMIKQLSYKPHIIFTTAYDQYAIRAFEENSLDYLLKPIEDSRLEVTINKIGQLDFGQQQEQIRTLIERLEATGDETIAVTLGDRIKLVKIQDIAYFHAEDKYVFIHTLKGDKHLLSTSLVELERKLNASFIRIHRAYIIHKSHIGEIRKSFNGKYAFVMNDSEKSSITSSQTYASVIRKVLLT